MRRYVLGGAAVLGAAAVAAGGLADALEAGAPAKAVPVAVPRLRHLVVVVMENHNRTTILDSPAASEFRWLARNGASLSNYHAVTHPSLPNYLALVSGSTHGIGSDCTTCVVRGPSLASVLPAAAWKTYAEGIPAPGWRGAAIALYAKKHDPLLYFTNVIDDRARRERVVPLSTFAHDLRRKSLPRFSLVVPDLCHDMHSCAVRVGNSWLRGFLGPLLQSPAIAGGAVFVVFDEGTTSTTVPAFAVGPAVRPGSTFSRRTDHYGLLRTIEQALDVRPLLGHAATAQAIGSIWR